MTIEQVMGLVVALLLMGVGVVGCFVPGIPGAPLVFGVVVAHKFYFGETGVDWYVMAILGGLTVMSLGVEYVATVYGARKMGATWRGIVGAILGGLVGIFFGFIGVLVGPFAGAVLFEIAGGRGLKQASSAGIGAVVGLLAGALGKGVICGLMMVIFAVDVVFQCLD